MEMKSYTLGETQVSYLITEQGRTSLLILPRKYGIKCVQSWERPNMAADARKEYNPEWRPGSLVQLHLRHHDRSLGSGATMKFSQSTDNMYYEGQQFIEETGQKRIITKLSSEEGISIVHTLTWTKGQTGLFCETELINEGHKRIEVEMLTSFCLENLSPYHFNSDQTGKLNLHRFKGSWALEGLHLCQTAEELGLQKAWYAPFQKSEKFGSIGSWTTQNYFPMAAVEDKESGIFWAAALEHNASWQMELSRDGDTLSFSGGIADFENGAWMKALQPGEHFCAPRAYIATVKGDLADACQTLTRLENIAADTSKETGLPVVFNEYCTSWGNPTQKKVLEYAELLQGKEIRYLVIDAGWSLGSNEQLGNGEWVVDPDRFPDMKGMNLMLREKGFIPGIWFEFEVTTSGSKVFQEAYDDMHLKRNGVVIHTGKHRSYWDFTNPEVIEYLTRHVIGMLREYGFGYLKVDYNGNIGLGCDGAESLGEGLRRQMAAVHDFFLKIKKELPDIVIENCASGGNRTEPLMLGVTDMTSFSDAHEAREIPYIAANLQNLVLPRQNQIWIVLRSDDSREKLEYSMAAGFLGRMCISGDIDRLRTEQWNTVSDGLEFYKKLENILLHGITKIYGERSVNIRHPKGTQIAVRRNNREILMVCHGYEESAEEMVISIGRGYRLHSSFGRDIFKIGKDKITVRKMKDWTAGAVYLVRD